MLRSFLTLAGIILATTTLIALMSLIHGRDVYIAEKVSVFMVVGGVVIMNIMLAVVSAVLSASGGLFGVVIAWVFAVAIRSLTPVPMSMPLGSIAPGVGLSMTVGLFFGIWPANKAARLDPVEALRYE